MILCTPAKNRIETEQCNGCGRHPVSLLRVANQKQTGATMPIIDAWCEYSQTKAMPGIDESWSFDHREDNQIKAIDKPRYCKKCGHKLSRYNTSKYCWNGSCQPKDDKPKRVQRRYVASKAKYCQMCGNEITRGKYCGQCHNMFAARRRSWKRKYPNIAIPDTFLFRQRGESNSAERYL